MFWAKFWVTTHRWLAIVLVSLLVVWSVSGLLFHIKPRTLDATAVRTLVADAIARSQFRAGYGEITNVAIDGDTARVTTSGGPVVELGVHDARASQRGRDTDRIDWLYRIHYLQWTGNRTLDKWLALAGLALIWAVMIPGIVLFVRRYRR